VDSAINAFVKKGVITEKQAESIVTKFLKDEHKIRQKLKKEGQKQIRNVKKKVANKYKEVGRNISKKMTKATKKIFS